MNVKTIKLTENLNEVQAYLFRNLLRSAKHQGDIERVNHYIIGQLNYQQVRYEILK